MWNTDKRRTQGRRYQRLSPLPSLSSVEFLGQMGWGASANDVRYTLHFTANVISVLPAFQRADDIQSAAVSVNSMAYGSISGNALLTGECGVTWLNGSTNSIVLKNDFSGATWRALDYQGSNGFVRQLQVIKNVLNQAKTYHLKMNYPESGSFFLQKNTYTNTVGGSVLFLDAAASPVHIMP